EPGEPSDGSRRGGGLPLSCWVGIGELVAGSQDAGSEQRVGSEIEGTATRVLVILGVLGVPAVCAPLLVRARGRLPSRLWRLLAAIIVLIPLSAPWLLVKSRRPLVPCLVAILGGIVMLKAIDWLARPRQEGALVRVGLALTFWPALEI